MDEKKVNVPENLNTERPGSEEEKKERIEIISSLTEEEETPSKVEEDLLRSSSGETEGEPTSPPMDKPTWESQRMKKRRLKRNLRRTRLRREQREAQREEGFRKVAPLNKRGVTMQTLPKQGQPCQPKSRNSAKPGQALGLHQKGSK